jgi:hypothetical protein
LRAPSRAAGACLLGPDQLLVAAAAGRGQHRTADQNQQTQLEDLHAGFVARVARDA